MTPQKKKLAKKLRKQGKMWKEIASIPEVDITTLYSNKVHK